MRQTTGYKGVSSCFKNPKISNQIGGGNDRKLSAVAAFNPAIVAAKRAARRVLQTIRSSLQTPALLVYPAPVGGDHHNHSSTAAQVVASGAARIARGTLANVECSANGPVSWFTIASGAQMRVTCWNGTAWSAP